MDNTIYNDILLHIRTTKEVDVLLQKIDGMLDAIFKLNQQSFAQIFAGELRSEISTSVQNSLSQIGVTFAQPAELKEFLTSLKNLLQTTTVLTLTISFAPSDEATSLISSKTKELFGVTTLLEINIQESILGGAMIIFKGKYLDYSLRTKIDQVFKNKSKEITAILGNKNSEV